MQDFERLGVFYLGRRYDVGAKKVTPDLVLYDSKDLVTHALCVGMTGSGKTGLGIAAIEEAAIDGVPVIGFGGGLGFDFVAELIGRGLAVADFTVASTSIAPPTRRKPVAAAR